MIGLKTTKITVRISGQFFQAFYLSDPHWSMGLSCNIMSYQKNVRRTKYGCRILSGQNMAATICPPDILWLPYSVLVCHTSSGQNAAAIFCPDKIRQLYFVLGRNIAILCRPDKIWQSYFVRTKINIANSCILSEHNNY